MRRKNGRSSLHLSRGDVLTVFSRRWVVHAWKHLNYNSQHWTGSTWRAPVLEWPVLTLSIASASNTSKSEFWTVITLFSKPWSPVIGCWKKERRHMIIDNCFERTQFDIIKSQLTSEGSQTHCPSTWNLYSCVPTGSSTIVRYSSWLQQQHQAHSEFEILT